ncbi:peptidoglycan DD-metalloendopeptidase family protein [Brevundimonas sp.]|uniref:peptidoglycan DD-metalloendopeptidase family protein n=1 Tax=Brevundimonas sp. TaxID=1871086 RepID=UPI0017E31781|nr:peptidoglycan DD-metalloendopeptidase family protein [Brevundimonas sp.]MBU3971764.1 M23 family metallopeptidase [Alphaproteobacteria bacterium]MBA3050303.1 M23 family metallopeptidase [Brevundimonas sp.]MBU3973150.1 M23 family metallopeptidase [Alphaproteobacteria bacterium]MBU4039571.1 M23 family metallopeptidase [Alphaproteobacteria bacterium]MBU4137880.1 M23 family metallopeptidase [Alphaproteobacteria bacterium]
MSQFDPRTRPARLAPHLLTVAAAMAVALLSGRVEQPVRAEADITLSPAQVAALEAKALAAASAPAGLTTPETVPVKIRSGETFEQAVQRTGIGAGETRTLIDTLAGSVDVRNLRPGQRFETAISRHRAPRSDRHLIGLTLRTGPASQLTVSRSFDGALRLRSLEETILQETRVAKGRVAGPLATSLRTAGVDAAVLRAATDLVSLAISGSGVKAGDPFAVAFDRTVTEGGRTIETGALVYVAIKGRALYRFKPEGARRAAYFDAAGVPISPQGMRTPLDSMRVSSAFGPRRHPITGLGKSHTGTDLAAGMGTPVRAPADGVVVEARRWGGYGNWVRIRHPGGLESGFAHLSRFASDLRAGQRVSQGQVVAYVGSTGASTGPHLHYEVWERGQRVDPAGVTSARGPGLAGPDLATFRVEKARIDRILASGGQRRSTLDRVVT